MNMDELLRKVKEKYEDSLKEKDDINRLLGDTHTELSDMKNKYVNLEAKYIKLKSDWDKLTKLMNDNVTKV